MDTEPTAVLAPALAPMLGALVAAPEAAELGAADDEVVLHAAMIAGTETRPAAPAMPFRTVRRESASTRLGSAMLILLLRRCPTKSDRISQIVPASLPHVKGLRRFVMVLCWTVLTFWQLHGNVHGQEGADGCPR